MVDLVRGPVDDAGPTLQDLAGAVARRLWLVLGAGLLGVLAAALWIRLTVPEYRAAMVIGPAAGLTESGFYQRLLETALPNVPGAAQGLIERRDAGSLGRFVALLTSVEVARELAAEDGVPQALFPEAWDAHRGVWRPPDDPLSVIERRAAALLGRPGWQPPGPEDLARRLKRRLSIEPIGGSGMYRLSLQHPDRDMALRLLTALHGTADGLLRAAAADRAAAQIGYLNQQLARVTLAEHRRGLAALLTQQERARMLIQVDLPYAAELVAGPTAPLRPTWPEPVLMLPLSGMAGLFAGILVVFLRVNTADGRRGAMAQDIMPRR